MLSKTGPFQPCIQTGRAACPLCLYRVSQRLCLWFLEHEMKKEISYDKHANGAHFGSNPASKDGHRVYPMDTRPSHASATQKSPAAQRKKSAIDYVAPPIRRVVPDAPGEEWDVPKCCFCLNIRIGSAIIGILELIFIALAFYGIAHWCMDTASDPETSARPAGRGYRPTISRNGLLAGSIITLIVVFFTILALFYGLWKERTNYMIPHLVVQAFGILGAIAGIVMASIAIAILRPKMNDTEDEEESDLSDKDSPETYNFVVGILVYSIFLFLIEVYGFLLVRNCARYYNYDPLAPSDAEMGERVVGSRYARNPSWHTHSSADPK